MRQIKGSNAKVKAVFRFSWTKKALLLQWTYLPLVAGECTYTSPGMSGVLHLGDFPMLPELFGSVAAIVVRSKTSRD